MKIKKRIVYYENNLWFLDDDMIWKNATNMWKKEENMKKGIGRRIKEWYKVLNKGKDLTSKPNGRVVASDKEAYEIYTYDAITKPTTKIKGDMLASFTNGWLDRDLDFKPNKFPFSTTQIKLNYNENAIFNNKDVDEYLNWMTNGDESRKKALTATLATLLLRDAHGVLGILYSPDGGTGKSQFCDLYHKISGGKIKRVTTENTLGKASQNNKFSLTGIENKTGLLGDELPKILSQAASDKLKDFIDPGKSTMAFENKGKDSDETDNIIDMVITTNRISTWYEPDNALKSRITVINITPDKDKMPKGVLRKNFKNNLLLNDDALSYLLSISINNYKEACKGYRAEGFRFGLPDTDEYWEKVADVDGVISEFAGYGLDNFIENREDDFIINERFKRWYDKWKGDNLDSNISSTVMKKKVVEYLDSVYKIKARLSAQKKIDGKNKRGILLGYDR